MATPVLFLILSIFWTMSSGVMFKMYLDDTNKGIIDHIIFPLFTIVSIFISYAFLISSIIETIAIIILK